MDIERIGLLTGIGLEIHRKSDVAVGVDAHGAIQVPQDGKQVGFEAGLGRLNGAGLSGFDQ